MSVLSLLYVLLVPSHCYLPCYNSLFLTPLLLPTNSLQWDLYYKGSELYHRNQWKELVEVMEASILELPKALQQCRDECYGPLRLGRRMGFAQVRTITLTPPKLKLLYEPLMTSAYAVFSNIDLLPIGYSKSSQIFH